MTCEGGAGEFLSSALRADPHRPGGPTRQPQDDPRLAVADGGGPGDFLALIVPLREVGALLPQLFIAGFLRRLALRKWVWVAGAGIVYSAVQEFPGTTEGGGNAWDHARTRLRLLIDDRPFRDFVTVRALAIGSGLSAPFVVSLSRAELGGGGWECSSPSTDLLQWFRLPSGADPPTARFAPFYASPWASRAPCRPG